VTPGADPTSLFALAIPLYFLFEMSVVLSTIIYRQRLRREARRAALADAEVALATEASLAVPVDADAGPVRMDQGGLA
ncbi:MAG: hypothetical protein ACXWZS_15990, partial [Gemmatirosa sp.]